MRARAWGVAAAAAMGVAISANLVLGGVTGIAWFCDPTTDCGAIHASRYATFLGVPTSALGVVLYGVVLWLAVSGLSSRRWLTVFFLSVVAASTSVYLAYLAWDVVHRACVYCLVSAAVAGALVVAVLVTRPAVGERGALLRPSSLAALACVTALATVAVVAIVLGVAGAAD